MTTTAGMLRGLRPQRPSRPFVTSGAASSRSHLSTFVSVGGWLFLCARHREAGAGRAGPGQAPTVTGMTTPDSGAGKRRNEYFEDRHVLGDAGTTITLRGRKITIEPKTINDVYPTLLAATRRTCDGMRRTGPDAGQTCRTPLPRARGNQKQQRWCGDSACVPLEKLYACANKSEGCHNDTLPGRQLCVICELSTARRLGAVKAGRQASQQRGGAGDARRYEMAAKNSGVTDTIRMIVNEKMDNPAGRADAAALSATFAAVSLIAATEVSGFVGSSAVLVAAVAVLTAGLVVSSGYLGGHLARRARRRWVTTGRPRLFPPAPASVTAAAHVNAATTVEDQQARAAAARAAKQTRVPAPLTTFRVRQHALDENVPAQDRTACGFCDAPASVSFTGGLRGAVIEVACLEHAQRLRPAAWARKRSR